MPVKIRSMLVFAYSGMPSDRKDFQLRTGPPRFSGPSAILRKTVAAHFLLDHRPFYPTAQSKALRPKVIPTKSFCTPCRKGTISDRF
jgi:hypothetical protein